MPVTVADCVTPVTPVTLLLLVRLENCAVLHVSAWTFAYGMSNLIEYLHIYELL
jgi:hypothetical protein